MTRPPLSVGVLGDVMLGRGVADALRVRAPEELWGPDLRALGQSLDVVVANLECCISDRGSPTTLVRGKPFFFRAPPSAALALEAMNVRIAGLANNHALDYGDDALGDTLSHLRTFGIETVGAGFGDVEARQSATVATERGRVGVVAFSDHPHEYAASRGRWGVAYADLHEEPPAWLAAELARLRERCDAVVAFPHWGPNMTSRPAPWQRATARRLQELGADLVAGHSSHCFHGADAGPRGPILSDLGGAIDDYRVDPDLRNDLGVMAVWRPRERELELVGLALEHAYTDLASGRDADWIADRLAGACEQLGTHAVRTAQQRFRVVTADG